MAEGDSPTIARLRVRVALREAREAAGLTQLQVAEEMEWSNSKVIRIEKGDVTVSINDLRGLLTLLGVRDKTKINSLLADARIARTRQKPESVWWQEARFRDQMSESFRKLVEYEAEASQLRSFNIFYIPGPLQTAEYGTALTGTWMEEADFSQEKVDTMVEARAHRREALARRGDALDYMVLLDQSVLMRSFGGPTAFVRQLRLLIDLSKSGLYRLRMLPFSLEIAIANNGSFELATVGVGRANNEIMYRETGLNDEIIETRVETARHRRRFDQLWKAADNEGDTIAYVQKRIDELEANPHDVKS
ncbi:helix-turn-helix transcriptional regulator [Actinoplanes sp. NPDC048796]|uniref:helix-turn-helix domain-containing protein n=1 Tax=unclassified Actinoplanes TaxID=2626549 RepID=UPI0033E51917